MDIFGTDLLVALGSAFPFPGGGGLVTLDTAFSNLVTMTGHCTVDDNTALLATLDAASSNLVTVTGYLSIDDNAALANNNQLATLDTAFGNLVTLAGYSSIHDKR